MLKDSPAFSGFSVKSIDQAKEFYGNTLGLGIEDMQGMGIKLKVAGGTPVFVYSKEDHTPATFTILNFPVEDIESAVDELTAKGIKFESYANMTDEKGIAWGKKANRGPNIAWFKDPFGNVLSILQD